MKSFRPFLITLIGFALFFFAPVTAFAHELDFAVVKTDFAVKGNVITFKTEMPLFIDFGGESDEAVRNFYTTYYNEQFYVNQKEFKCNIAVKNVERFEQEQKTVIEGTYTCANRINSLAELQITSTAFSDLFKKYDHFVRVTIKGKTKGIIFKPDQTSYPPQKKAASTSNAVGGDSSAASNAAEFKNGESGNFWMVVKQFTVLGVEHIVFGYDHLLFLLTIVLLFSSFRRILLLVTSFTTAHTITLIAASSGLITVSPKLVEPTIALPIAYMAIRNIWILKRKKSGGQSTVAKRDSGLGQNDEVKNDEIKERWMVVFGFGLIHGLGFAGALGEIGIPKEHFLSSLLSFNLGVELGQLMILAIVMPYLILLKPKKFRNKILYGVSAAIALIAIVWFFQRVIG